MPAVKSRASESGEEPFQKPLGLAIAALVPIAPPLLTVMPLEELLKLMLGLLR